MTNHRLAIELIQKTVDRRKNTLANLLAVHAEKQEPVDQNRFRKLDGGIRSYEESIRVLTGDELGKNSEGPAYAGYGSDPVGNEDRAGWAMEAVRHYARQNRFGEEAVIEDGDTEHLDEALGDLLNDCLHLAHRSGLDPEVLIDRARRGYEEELLEEEQAECARCGDPISEADEHAKGEVCGDCAMQIEYAGSEAEQAQYDFPWVKQS